MPTAVTACPADWTAAPNASWSAACYGVLEERANSLRECVEACGHHEAVPVCVGSEEENAFAVALVGDDGSSWLGLYQSDTSGGAEGWARCVGGAAPGFSNWANGHPDWYRPEDCAVISGQGEWHDVPCDDEVYRCLCAGPANASASFAQDLDELEAAWAAHMRETLIRAFYVAAIVAIVALVPSLMFLCHLARANLRRRRSTAADGGGGEQTSSTEAEASHSATVRSLRAARRSAARRRLQVSFAMIQAGWALVVLGLAQMYAKMYEGAKYIDIGPFTYYLLLVPPGLYLLLLALLPTDARAIRVVCAVFFALWLFGGVSFSFLVLMFSRVLQDALGLFLPGAVLFLAAAAGVGPTLPCHGCRCVRVMEPRQALRRLWLVARLFSAGLGVHLVSYFTVILATEEDTEDQSSYFATNPRHPNNPGALAFGAAFLLCAALATPANRGRLHRRLGRIGARGSQAEEAAAVAALVGGADPAEALQRATALFRCLPAASLVAADLANSNLSGPSATPSDAATPETSAAGLAKKTQRANLGEVTAFFSHSWSDEKEAPGAKLAAVVQWAQQHRQATGEEPTLWLDKACIDQENIDQSLACLPIFLAGCKRLLIVAGPTYTSRLWCVMEIFTFLQMGGGLERIDIYPLLTSAADRADRQARRDRLMEQFAAFDAAKAQCFLNKDRQRLLAVVEAGFGDFKEFNKRVRAVFAARAASRQTTVALPAVLPAVVQEDGLQP